MYLANLSPFMLPSAMYTSYTLAIETIGIAESVADPEGVDGFERTPLSDY